MRKAALFLVIALSIAPAGLADAHSNKSFSDENIKGSYGLLSQGTLFLATTPPFRFL